MKIGIGQINMDLWNIADNTQQVYNAIDTIGKDCEVLVFPELTIPWSPGNDMYENQSFIDQQAQVPAQVQQYLQSIQSDLTVILWYIQPDPTAEQPGGGVRKYNTAAVITKDTIKTTHKQNLCDYDVFYESRHMHPGRKYENFAIGDEQSTVTICEDLFNLATDFQPLEHRDMQWVKTIFNLSSSPFADGKLYRRIEAMKHHAIKRNANVVYLNQVGAQDDNIFDGGSFIIDKNGKLIHLSPQFKKSLAVVDTEQAHEDLSEKAKEIADDKYGQIDNAIKLWLQDYMKKSWIEKVVIGVSWGIDSSISLYYLSQVMPKRNIVAIYMPSKHSTNSQTDAHQLCENLWIKLHEREIQTRFDAIQDRHKKEFWNELEHDNESEKIAYENIQARIRWNILMEISNLTPRSMIINNSNKTEMLMGYGTLHGDMIGAINAIGDLNKKEVYALANYINQKDGNVIPTNIIHKPASAELNVDQVDPFDYDRVSEAIDELGHGSSIEDVVKKYNITEQEAKDYARRIRNMEYKRREFYPIILKIKSPNMGIGRRYPVVRKA